MGESLTNGQEHHQRRNDDSGADPSSLTTEALLREIGQLKSLIYAEMRGDTKVFEGKFNAVEKQFESAERQRIEQKSDVKMAVDAALSAQKEAVKEQTLASERAISKSEAATTKQLDQQAAGFAASLSGVFSQINEAKERIGEVKEQINRSEGNKQGGTDRANNINAVIIAVLSLITIGSVIFGLLQHVPK